MAPSIDRRDTVPIPQPKSYPVVGNLHDLDRNTPVWSFMKLAEQYGPIFALQLGKQRRIFVNNVELLSEICDEKRFAKALGPALVELRHVVNDGLFTSWTKETNWGLAHRILTPAFGPLKLQSMFSDMKGIVSQCLLKWARFGPDYKIEVTEDWTRLTLDTLALTTMGFRFNSFYSEQLHPFVISFMGALACAGARTTRPSFLSSLHRREDAKFFESIKYMRKISGDLVQERRDHPIEGEDLLSAMINGKDSKTGQTLSEQCIIDNMITFLVAGHETTSGLLSFTTYYLLKNPEAYRRAQEEVDEVLGKDAFRPEHFSKLPYLQAALRETLRLSPSAPIWNVQPKDPSGEVIGSKYFVDAKEIITANLGSVHRDPAVYGEDSNEFRPERMLDENMASRPSYAWMPFGNGVRACIGRHFAWQEALLAMAMLLQSFDLTMVDPSYDLQVKQTVTQKPVNFEIHAKLRQGISIMSLEQSLSGKPNGTSAGEDRKTNGVSAAGPSKPITVLYGSNSGTCEAFARTLAKDAAAHGFEAGRVATLDSVKGSLPEDQPIVIVTASYEGEPCDNAKHFLEWLETLPDEKILNIHYAVFGAGHSDWKKTFFKVPTAIDRMLAAHGGNRICNMGNANAAKGEMMSEFQTWEDDVFWPALGGAATKDALTDTDDLTVEVSNRRDSTLRTGLQEAKIVAIKTLTGPGVPEKRHIEVKLPSTMTYTAGDYLALLPLNPDNSVRRAISRFGLPWDATLTIKARTETMLPTEQPISAHDLFSSYVELSQPATKRDLKMLQDASPEDKTKVALSSLLDNFADEIASKRVSLLDLLDRFPSIELPLNAFLSALVPMRVRQYSISSSPLSNANHATLTYAVLDQAALSGQGRYQGVASTFLSSLRRNDSLHVAIKASNQSFHLPSNSESVPLVLVCAGTGFAPFRGFIQERAALLAAGRKVAPAHLFVGCRHPDEDELYREEMAAWEAMGAVTTHRAYSGAPDKSKGNKHVQDVLWSERELLHELWQANARVFVCGSRQLGESVRQISLDIFKDGCKRRGEEADDDRANKWFDRMRNERYATDVFA